MALIKCRECGKMISDNAKFCPECGFVYQNNHSIIKTILICIGTIVVLFSIIILIILFPKISDSIKAKRTINNIIGEYKIIKSSKEGILDKISINKDNTIYICNQGFMPPEIKDEYYNIYENNNHQYVVITPKTIGDDSNEYILLEYDNGKLVSQFQEKLSIKCRYGSSTGGKTNDINLEYQK